MRSNQNKSCNLITLLLLLLMDSFIAFTQTKSIDSLKEVLLLQKKDTNKVHTLNLLSKQLFYANKYTHSLPYALQALGLAKKLNHKKGMEDAYWAVIASYYGLSDYDNYIEFSTQALRYFENSGNLKRIGFYLNNMALINDMMGDTTETLRNLFAALKVREQIDDKVGIIQSINAIGLTYSKQGKLAEAMKMHNAALQIWRNLPDKKGFEEMIAFTYQSLAVAYEAIGEQAENQDGMKITINEYQKALEKYQMSYDIWKGLDDEDGMANLNAYIGNLLVKLKRYDSANVLLQKALSFYLVSGNNENMPGIYLSLSQIDTAKGDYKKAYENYKLHIFYKEALDSKNLIRKVEINKSRSEFEKKESQLKVLSAQNKLQAVLAKEQQQKKNIAYAGIGLILLTGGYSFYRFRKRKSNQSKDALNNERLRISQELHDEVGATLSGISMYSHLTKEQIKYAQKDEVEKSLNIMQQSAGDMVNKLNDIVWFINPDQDTLQKLLQRLEEYAGDMAAIKNMQVKISLPEILSTQSLPVESRRNIYLFCKEAINNAVKYSEADLLQLTVQENNHQLEITITDNGKGFDATETKRGNGLNNMQKRSGELGADFTIQSNLQAGTLISLKVKIT